MSKRKPKYYKYRIEWIDLTPEMMQRVYGSGLSGREFNDIGMSINYTGEYFRQLFHKRPSRLNKKIYDAIIAYIEKNEKNSNGVADPPVVDKQLSPFMQQRQKSKQATK